MWETEQYFPMFMDSKGGKPWPKGTWGLNLWPLPRPGECVHALPIEISLGAYFRVSQYFLQKKKIPNIWAIQYNLDLEMGMSREGLLGLDFLTILFSMIWESQIMIRFWMPRSFATFNPFPKVVAYATLLITNPSPWSYVNIEIVLQVQWTPPAPTYPIIIDNFIFFDII